MTFTNTPQQLDHDLISIDEVIESIINAPCFYTIRDDLGKTIVLDANVIDKGSQGRFVVIYSHTKLAFDGAKEFDCFNGFVTQWKNPLKLLQKVFNDNSVDGLILDPAYNPNLDLVEGLALEKASLVYLLEYYSTNNI